MKKRIVKFLKVFLIILLSLLLISVIGALIIYNSYIKPHSEEIINAVNQITQDETILEEIAPYLENEELENVINNIDEKQLVEDIQSVLDEYLNVQSGIKNPLLDAIEKSENENKTDEKTETTQNNSPDTTTEQTKTPKKPASSYSSKYEYVKDNVKPSDFATGLAFASRIDTGYVLGLLSGGLTSSEKSTLYNYLKQRFSSAEIAQGVKLYSKYSYLLK